MPVGARRLPRLALRPYTYPSTSRPVSVPLSLPLTFTHTHTYTRTQCAFSPAFLARPRPPVPRTLPPAYPAFSTPQGFSPLFTPFRLPPDSTLPRTLRPSRIPSLERAFPPYRRSSGGRRRREESEWGRGEPRTGASMAEARGQGERASSPTLTSNKGGELMREGARADTCGYRPTPAIKPSTADPRKTLELNPPRRRQVPPACARRRKEKQVKKNIFSAAPRAKFRRNARNESPTRVRVAREEVTKVPRDLRLACVRIRNFKENKPAARTARRTRFEGFERNMRLAVRQEMRIRECTRNFVAITNIHG